MLIALAVLPKVSALLSSIPGPVMAGYLIVLSAYLFVDGARTVIQSEQNRQRITVAGICFWIAPARSSLGLFSLADVLPVWRTLLKSGITTGGVATIVMVLYLEFTNPRRMRFHSALHIDALPDLNEFLTKFANRRGWDTAMKERLSAVAEETLLTFAPLELEEPMNPEDDHEPEKSRTKSPTVNWWSSPPVTARWRPWSSSAGPETRRIWKIDCASSSSSTRKRRLSRSYRSYCCGPTPRR